MFLLVLYTVPSANQSLSPALARLIGIIELLTLSAVSKLKERVPSSLEMSLFRGGVDMRVGSAWGAHVWTISVTADIIVM